MNDNSLYLSQQQSPAGSSALTTKVKICAAQLCGAMKI
jgi:hypothetical protein